MLAHVLKRTAPLALAAVVLAACDRDTTAPNDAPVVSVAPGGRSPISLEWQERARALVSANRLSALAAGRVYAAVSVAQHRALRAAEQDGTDIISSAPMAAMRGPDVEARPDAAADVARFPAGARAETETVRGAVAGASARVLGWFFPASAASLEALLYEQGTGGAGKGKPNPQFARGIEIGQTAGNQMIARLEQDGFTKPWTGTVPVGPGKWIPSALPPAGVMLGQVTPYYMTSGAQFRPPPPPAITSDAFKTDLAEVLTLTQNITPEQLAFARYWDFPGGSPTPIGYWNGVAAQYVTEGKLNERAATEVFALMHAAVFDALIGCWEAKYHYWLLRPSQADPAITLAFTLPNFPAYPSGHSCASASAARVLTHFFPQKAASLEAQVGDAGLSRILAGIHYRFDVTAGQTLGRSVADWALLHGAP